MTHKLSHQLYQPTRRLFLISLPLERRLLVAGRWNNTDYMGWGELMMAKCLIFILLLFALMLAAAIDA